MDALGGLTDFVASRVEQESWRIELPARRLVGLGPESADPSRGAAQIL